MGLWKKFIEKTLTQADIKRWLKKQGQIKLLVERRVLTEKNLDHIARLIHQIYLAYHDMMPRTGLGHFLTAIVKNDLEEACGRADSINRFVLPIYIRFLYNYAPANYREQILEE